MTMKRCIFEMLKLKMFSSVIVLVNSMLIDIDLCKNDEFELQNTLKNDQKIKNEEPKVVSKIFQIKLYACLKLGISNSLLVQCYLFYVLMSRSDFVFIK